MLGRHAGAKQDLEFFQDNYSNGGGRRPHGELKRILINKWKAKEFRKLQERKR